MLTEEDCWSFFADSVAPFTVGGSSRDQTSTSTTDESDSNHQHSNLIISFLKMLVKAIEDLQTYQVHCNCYMFKLTLYT